MDEALTMLVARLRARLRTLQLEGLALRHMADELPPGADRETVLRFLAVLDEEIP